MQESKLPSNSQYVIVTVSKPVMFHQTEDETWLFNPNRRYLINASRIPAIHPFIESVSELDNSSLVNPLRAGKAVTGAKILVERFRERGIGDLLFLTGPLSYIHHCSGANCTIDLYAFSDRGMVLTGGGALLRNLDRFLARETGVPCYPAENPIACVAIGAGRAVEQLELVRKSMVQV